MGLLMAWTAFAGNLLFGGLVVWLVWNWALVGTICFVDHISFPKAVGLMLLVWTFARPWVRIKLNGRL